MATAGEIGERALIERMHRWITPMPGTPLPLWEDASAIDLRDGRVAVLNTDMLVWETDVPPGMTPYQAARKAVVMNFSDLGAKGVPPLSFMASIGIPRDLEVEIVEEMAKGFEAGTREYGGYVIGGDTNEASDIVISGVAFGVSSRERIMTRKGAKPDEILATTGPFGLTAAALKTLLTGLEAPEGLKEALVQSIYNPKARVREGIALAESGAVTSAIDSSDGLSASLHDLSRSSKVGFRVEALPIPPEVVAYADHHELNPDDLALYGGEEYELVFTVEEGRLEEAREALALVGCRLLELGVATSETDIRTAKNGVETSIEKWGWEHFMGA
ncbi:MAG: thiamine-phosphate kinase [Candidatus Bathyarchaeota archaeon]|jgi:thiamine-monophosphate kinase|nr:thiamine-phosphate kinase [Candidatus Bathyarchaeota archaeon]